MPKKSKSSSAQKNLFRRAVPKMPEGYYSGDKPNPNLRAFVEQHLKEKPYDPATDKYNVPAFNTPIETTKATAIYNMHTYWSKKPHDAIRQYIRHYTQEGDLVLDPFCGSGGTALAALMEGRQAIAIDRSPAATFITKNYCTPVDVDELQRAFEELERAVKPEMDWLYETRCDRCDGKALTAYTVYSQVFQCPRCMEKVALFDCVEVDGETAEGKPKKISVCPYCLKRGQQEEISTRTERFGSIPVLVSYLCKNGCKPARDERRHNDADKKKRAYFEKYDLGKLREIESKPIPHWYPPNKMMNVEDDSQPWGDNWRPGRNFRSVAALFTKRNLWALGAILEGIDSVEESTCKDALRFTVSSFLLNLSRLYKHRDSGGGQPTGNYYIPQINRENEAWSALERKFKDIIDGMSELVSSLQTTQVFVSTQSSESLGQIPSNSVDFVFTDPPYAGKYQYGELNFIWEAWLGLDTHWHREEITINPIRGTTEADWATMMIRAMSECYRVLKPGHWVALCYHDTSEGTWELIQDVMSEAGFLIDKSDTAIYIDTGQKTYNQSQGDKVTKRDLVINFRKPRADEIASDLTITGDEDETTFNDKVHLTIREYLTAHPGATKDRIYDEVVSRMVRAGQMQAHNFDALLEQVAEPVREPIKKNLFENEPPNFWGTHEIVRWFVRQEQAANLDAAETAKEDKAAKKLSAYISEQRAAKPYAEGVHYSDLFEQYIYFQDKPRRALIDWLPDYFFKTDAGTWRAPADEQEEQEKAHARASGANRRIKHFIAYLQQAVPIPEASKPNAATLADWIRQSKRAGLYEYGKLIYEKGGINLDALPEELAVDVEEDYQTCVRMLARKNDQ